MFHIQASYKCIEISEQLPHWLGSACAVFDMPVSQRLPPLPPDALFSPFPRSLRKTPPREAKTTLPPIGREGKKLENDICLEY